MRKRESWARFSFYLYGWPFIHSLYFIYAGKFYVHSHEKITRQWKSTLMVMSERSSRKLRVAIGFLFLFISDPGGSYLISFETILILLIVGDRIDYLLVIYTESKGGRIHNTTLFYYQYRHGELLSNVFECADILPSYIRDSSKSLPFGWWLNNQ